MPMKLFCFALCALLLAIRSTARAQQEDVWDLDRPEPTFVLKETKVVVQTIKRLPDKIKQVINRKSNADQGESDSSFVRVDGIDANKIQWRGIDDPNVTNRLRFDAVPSLEDSRQKRTSVLWTLVLAILTGFFALVMQIKRRLNHAGVYSPLLGA